MSRGGGKENWQGLNTQQNPGFNGQPFDGLSKERGRAFLKREGPFTNQDSLDVFIHSKNRSNLGNPKPNTNKLIMNNKNLQSSFNVFGNAKPKQRGNDLADSRRNAPQNPEYYNGNTGMRGNQEKSKMELPEQGTKTSERRWKAFGSGRFDKMSGFGGLEKDRGFQARIGHLNTYGYIFYFTDLIEYLFLRNMVEIYRSMVQENEHIESYLCSS